MIFSGNSGDIGKNMPADYQKRHVSKTNDFQSTVTLFFILLVHYVILIPLMCNAVNFLSTDYLRYTWTELMINYEGGFVRRGLLGQVLLYVSYYIPLNFIIPFSFFFIYIGFSYYFLIYLHSRLNFLTVLLVAISPGLLLFPSYEVAVFGRKDIIILCCILMMIRLCACSAALNGKKLSCCSCCFFVLYFIGFLVHEIMVFFFPMLFLCLLHVCRLHGKTNRLVMVGMIFFLLSLLLSFLFSSPQSVEDIASSWKHVVVNIPTDRKGSALYYLNFSSHEGLQYVFFRLKNAVTFFSTVLAFFLSFIPIFVALFVDNWLKPFKKMVIALSSETSFSFFLNFILVLSVLFPFITFFIVADSGRVIYLLGIVYLCFIAFFKDFVDTEDLIYNNVYDYFFSLRIEYLLVFALVYATSWRLAYIVDPGNTLLKVSVALYDIIILFF